MPIDGKIRDENSHCDINREAAKSAFSPWKIDKGEYHIVEEILLSDQSRIIEQAEFAYSALGKTNKNDWGSTQKANKSS